MMKHYLFVMLTVFLVSCEQPTETEYYANGSLKYEVPIVKNNRHGELKKFYESGELQYISNWNNGIKEGKAKLYFKSGNIKLIENYHDGFPNGKILEYDSNGNIIREMIYRNKLMISDSTFYPSGNLKNVSRSNSDTVFSNYYDNQGQLEELSVRYKDKLLYAKKINSKGQLESSFMAITSELKPEVDSTTIAFDIRYTLCLTCKYLVIINNRPDEELVRQEFLKPRGKIKFPSSKYPSINNLEGLVYEIDSSGQVLNYSLIPDLIK